MDRAVSEVRDALHGAVDDLLGTNADAAKWIATVTDAEALIASLPESREREVALERLMECCWWYELAATGTGVFDRATAKRAVRRMRR